MHPRTLGAAALTAALVLLPTAAHAGGSDSPTPYTVTAEGVTLPAGTTFEANGHLNYRVTALDGSGQRTFNVHQSVPHNGVWPRAAYVGKDYYPWADHPTFAAAFPDGHCVTWVQISGFNEHFGDIAQFRVVDSACASEFERDLFCDAVTLRSLLVQSTCSNWRPCIVSYY